MSIDKDLFGEVLISDKTNKPPKIARTKGKQRTLYDYFNLDILNSIPISHKDGMPVLEPYNGVIPNRMVGFEEAYTKKDTDCIVHFFEDDRRFLRLFRNPEKYLAFLKECSLVIEPDLSQYVNMPYPLRLAHAYLNRAMAVYLQKNGCRVVSNLTWSLHDSYQYSLAGRPKKSIVAVNCTGVLGHDMSMYLWREGYKNIVLPLRPTRIIRYGDRMPDENSAISVYFENERLERLRYGS